MKNLILSSFVVGTLFLFNSPAFAHHAEFDEAEHTTEPVTQYEHQERKSLYSPSEKQAIYPLAPSEDTSSTTRELRSDLRRF